MNTSPTTDPTSPAPPYSCFEAGPMSEWRRFQFRAPGLPPKMKQFLKEPLQLTSMEVSLDLLVPGEDMPFVHFHKEHEELYLFLSGEGEFQANGELLPVRAGTCIRCAPEVRRTWRNTGETDLVFLVIQAKDGSLREHFTVKDGVVAPERPLWMT